MQGASVSVRLVTAFTVATAAGNPSSANCEVEDGPLPLSVYAEKNGKISEVVADHVDLRGLAALAYGALQQPRSAREGPGLKAITEGFGNAGKDEGSLVAGQGFLDALYAHPKRY